MGTANLVLYTLHSMDIPVTALYTKLIDLLDYVAGIGNGTHDEYYTHTVHAFQPPSFATLRLCAPRSRDPSVIQDIAGLLIRGTSDPGGIKALEGLEMAFILLTESAE